MQKVKNVLGEFMNKANARKIMMMSLAMAVMCMSALAADGDAASIDTAGITAAFTNGFNNMVTNSIAMITAMVPIALTLAGVLFVVKKGMSWFKSIGKG